MLAIFWTIWQQAGTELAVKRRLDVPLKAALIAAIVAGLSGEYFYGGITLFALIAVYGTVGSLPVFSKKAAIDRSFLHMARVHK